MLDTSAIDNERKALQLLTEQVQQCSDDERDFLMNEIHKSAEKLQKMCDELQAKADEIAATAPKPQVDLEAVVEVVLTREQRDRVLAQTGIDVPSIRIPDPTAALTKNMVHIEPEFVEKCAIEQAERFKMLVEDANTELPETPEA